ncbi:chaperone protein DnaJ [Rosa sericea]
MEAENGLASYYSILGVNSESSMEEIKRAYRKLAMQYHPDRWTRSPSMLGEAKRRFQEIQEAYSVLSDQRKRTMYDAGLYDPDDEEDEGLCDFVQELVSLMAESRREQKSYSMEDLQDMFMEMVRGFEPSFTFCGPSTANFEHAQFGCAKRTRLESKNASVDTGSAIGMHGGPGFFSF